MIFSAATIILFSIVLSALFSGLETGTYTINKIRVHHNVQRQKKRAELVASNLKDTQLFIFMTLIGNNISVYLATGAVTELFFYYGIGGSELQMIHGFIPWSSEIGATLALMLPLFIFAEVGPKNLFRIKADTLMYDTAGIQYFFLMICKPITLPLKKMTELLMRSKGTTYSNSLRNINLQRLTLFLKESRDEGVINDRQNSMINNTLMWQKKMAIDIMTPVADILALSIDEVTVKNCITFLKHSPGNNIPVYDGNCSNIISYLNVIDVISTEINKDLNLKSKLNEIFIIDEKTDLQQAFYQLQSASVEIAAVKNSIDQVIGIVRLDDILRTITSQS